MGWWSFTRRMLEGLTRPRADVPACDRAVAELATGSGLVRAAHEVGVAGRRAWPTSRARAVATALGRLVTPSEARSAWRLRGWIAVVGGSTALGLGALKPTPAGPLAWLLPALVAGVGALTMSMAGPLARAAADRQTRRPRE